MKNNFIVALGILAIALGAVSYGAPYVKALASPSYVSVLTTSSASTSPSYMSAGAATTTFALYGTNLPNDVSVDGTQIDIAFTASSSAATLEWQNQWSNNGVDWYNQTQDSFTSNGLIDEASTTVTYRWTPGNTAASTTFKSITLPAYPAVYERVVFFIPPGSVSGAVYAEAALKHNAGSQ